jgi:acetate kinase
MADLSSAVDPIDRDVLARLERYAPLAPLHQPTIAPIRASRPVSGYA